jgi:hypothetical protein
MFVGQKIFAGFEKIIFLFANNFAKTCPDIFREAKILCHRSLLEDFRENGNDWTGFGKILRENKISLTFVIFDKLSHFCENDKNHFHFN